MVVTDWYHNIYSSYMQDRQKAVEEMNEEPIKKWVKVGKDESTGLWYYENSRGVRSQAIFANRKKAWAKGNDYIDMLYPKKNKRRGTNGI